MAEKQLFYNLSQNVLLILFPRLRHDPPHRRPKPSTHIFAKIILFFDISLYYNNVYSLFFKKILTGIYRQSIKPNKN